MHTLKLRCRLARSLPRPRVLSEHASGALLLLAVGACSSDRLTDSTGEMGASEVPLAAAVAPATVLAVGDIADCGSSGDEATARLADAEPGATILTLGDNAYEDGSTNDFTNCYQPNWGRHKARTRPSPGNHDYHTSGASAYYSYFGANAGPAGRGYYSFDLGDWHIISLNSNVSMAAGSAQEKWLRADLAASTKSCTLAYWHHPRFSSAKHGNTASTQPLYQALYDARADLVLVGHDHSYERFAPQTAIGTLDRTRGIRQFVVGTGGRKFYSLVSRRPNSEVFKSGAWGVLKLTLNSEGYAWQFLSVSGSSFTDSGSANCVGATSETPPPPAPPSEEPPPPSGPTIPQPPGENAARITLSYSDLVLGPPGAQATVSVRAFGADGREWSGVAIRWWKSSTTAFGLSVTECRSPCSSVLSTSAVGQGRVIVRHYGGVARDTMPVTITAESNTPTEPPPGEPPPGEPPPGEPPPGEPPPPPPPPPVGASCDLAGATVLAGTRTSQFRVDGVPAGRVYDARSFIVRYSGAGGAVRVAGGANICWHGGRVLGTMDSVTTSWATYHDAYGFHLTGNTLIIEDVYAENVGDGIKWVEENSNNFTVRRVHLKDMKDDCVETDWLRGGSITDVLFEGCYVFLGIRPRSSVSLNGSGNTITVDGAVVWHKHIRNGYSGEPDNAGQIFKVDGGTPSKSPRLRLRNIVLRVDPHPNTSGGGSPYSLNPGGIVVESANNTLVWTGAGAYPEAIPPGWTLTRDKGVYDRAVADWKARNPGR